MVLLPSRVGDRAETTLLEILLNDFSFKALQEKDLATADQLTERERKLPTCGYNGAFIVLVPLPKKEVGVCAMVYGQDEQLCMYLATKDRYTSQHVNGDLFPASPCDL